MKMKILAISVCFMLTAGYMRAPSAVSQFFIPPFSGAGATSNTVSSAVDISHAQNAAVQFYSVGAPGATILNVELRSTSAAPWYIAAQCTTIPQSGTVTSVCYFTLPLAKDMRVESTGYISGNLFAVYNERSF